MLIFLSHLAHSFIINYMQSIFVKTEEDPITLEYSYWRESFSKQTGKHDVIHYQLFQDVISRYGDEV